MQNTQFVLQNVSQKLVIEEFFMKFHIYIQ